MENESFADADQCADENAACLASTITQDKIHPLKLFPV